MAVAVISRNHKKDSENLHPYRSKKVSAGKRTIRKRRYPIQPHDIVIYDGRKYEISGCHNNGTRAILLPSKNQSVSKSLRSIIFQVDIRKTTHSAITRRERSRQECRRIPPRPIKKIGRGLLRK